MNEELQSWCEAIAKQNEQLRMQLEIAKSFIKKIADEKPYISGELLGEMAETTLKEIEE